MEAETVKFRRTRKVICVACLLVCLAVVAMWVRSYRAADRLHGRFWGRQSMLIASKQGRVTAVFFQSHGAPNWWTWGVHSYPVGDELSFPVGDMRQYERALGFGWITQPIYMVMRSTTTMPNGRSVMMFGAATATLLGAGPIIPYWCLVLFAAALAAVTRLPWPVRFSLRSMLFAITVVAFVLAMETVLSRWGGSGEPAAGSPLSASPE